LKSRAAAAAVIGVLSLPAVAVGDGLQPAQLEQTRGFCAARPTQVDTSVPAAVNALATDVPDTAPIAVLDTGADSNATELAGRLVSPFDALANAPNDGTDVDGHGTQVAGVAAGAPGLVRGVSPTSPIMPIRVYNGDGSSTTQAVVRGLGWAADHGATAITLSASQVMAKASDADITALTHAISQAFNRGIVVVAPSGNEGGQEPDMPAALPHVLTVGAVEPNGLRSTFSNVGWWVDLVAPGSALVAPMPKKFCESGYGLGNGTSYAAPAVAAGAAILAKLRPDLSAQQRMEILRSSARDVQIAGRDVETGHGLLDVGAALTAPAPQNEPSPEVDDDPFFVRGPFAAAHPTLLRTKQRASLVGKLSRAKDPADVYPVRLRKGERLVTQAVAAASSSLFSISIWKPGVGDFDVSGDVAKQRAVSTGGFAGDPQLKMRVQKSGTYFVSVEAPDLIDEDDEDAEIPESEAYTLKLSRQKIKPRPTPKKKKKKTSKSK
jgi:subtilase family protein